MATAPSQKTRSFAALLFGYDVFVSFALSGEERGSRAYASDLARRLRELDFTVFFSEDEAPVGGRLDATLMQGLRRARALVVVANLGTLRDPRWVRTEVEEFRRLHPGRPVVPISIGGALSEAARLRLEIGWLDHADRIWIDETADAATTGTASDAVLQRLATAPRAARSSVRLRALVGATLVFLTAVAAVAVWQAVLAMRNEAQAVANRTEADRNAAQAAANAASAATEAGRARKAEAEAVVERDRAASEAEAARRAEAQARAELAKAVALRLGADARALLAQGQADTDELALQLLVASQRLTPEAAADPELQHLLLEQWSALGPLERALVLPPGGAGLAFSPDGRLLLAGGADGQLHELSLSSLMLRTRRTPLAGQAIAALQFSRDGRDLIAATREGALVVLDADSLAVRAGPLTDSLGAFVPFALHPAGAELTAADGQGRLRRFDARTLRPLGPPVTGHRPRVWGLAYAPDGGVLASAGQDRELLLRDPTTLLPLGRSLGLGLAGPWLCVAFAPQADLLVACGGDILDAQKEFALELWPRQPGAREASARLLHRRMVTGAAFSPDGLRLATAGSDGSLALFRATASPVLIARWAAHRTAPEALAYGPDGRWIASRAGDGSLRLWHVDTRPTPGLGPTAPPSAPRATALHVAGGADAPGALRVVSGHEDGSVRLWRATLSVSSRLAAAEGAGSPVVAIGGRAEGTLVVLDASASLRRLDPGTLEVTAVMPRWPHAGSTLALSADGRQGAFVDRDGDVVWWDVDAGRQRARLLRGAASSSAQSSSRIQLQFSPAGDRLAIVADGESVRLWTPGRSPVTLPDSSGAMPTGVAFSGDGRTIAASVDGSTPKLWSLADPEPLAMEAPPTWTMLRPLGFDPQGRHLLAADSDRMWVWLRAGARWRPIRLEVAAAAAAVAADGRSFVVADAHGAPVVHPLPAGTADALCRVMGRNVSRARWARSVSTVLPYTCQCPGLPLAEGPNDGATGSRTCADELRLR